MQINTDPKKIEELLTRGASEVIGRESLKSKLLSGKKLRVKFGIDPTGSRLHIGHAVPLRKLKQFQEMGHQVILLIGDYTAMIGDPSGRNDTRPILSVEDVKKNMETYVAQVSKVLDMDNVEIRQNSEWYGHQNFTGLLMDLTSKVTVARILERDDFAKRLKEGSDIQMQEILYPLLQGYDSVALKADVELGGTDQKFNLLMGRKLQKRYDQPEQDVITVPILEGLDGVRKMSKTYDNFIALDDASEIMYGKIMSIPDDLIVRYFELTTEVPLAVIKEYEQKMKNGENPMIFKKQLAKDLVFLYHGEVGAQKGEEYFISTFSKKEIPDEIPELHPSANDIVTVLVESNICNSRSNARQMVEQGAVSVNGEKVDSIDYQVKNEDVIKKGSRFFLKIV